MEGLAMIQILCKVCKILIEKGPATIAAWEVGWQAAVGPLIALILLEVVECIQDHVQGEDQSRRLEELATNLKKVRAGQHLAADEIARLEGIPINDLPEGDLRVLYLVFYRFLRSEFEAIEFSHEEVTAALERLGDDQKQRWNTLLYREFPYLQKALDLTHNDLAALVREHNEFRQTIERQLDAQAVAPPLEFSLLVPEESMRFTYRAQRVPLFGRESEMSALRTFLEPNPSDAIDFRWWLWTGPGGAGKSRLAWELCLEAESQGWRVGFLEDEVEFHDWHRWNVDRKTLMVVDYCAKRPDQVRKAILGLTNNTNNIREPVRFLLLERSADSQSDAWWSRFERDGSTSKSAQLRHFVYWTGSANERPHDLTRFARPLEPPGDDALWSIIATVFEEQGKPPPQRDDVLKALKGIDPQGRPLFALLAAESLRKRGLDAIRQWDAPTLTNSILEHEFGRWRQECDVADSPNDDFERHLNLLTFVTIIGPQSFDIADRLADCNATVPQSGRDVTLDWWRRFVGYSTDPDRNRLVPLTPDILGELFVLLRLNGTLHAANNPLLGPPKDTLELWQIAWGHFPLAAANFLNRASHDFPAHVDLHKLTTSHIPNACPGWPEPSELERSLALFLVGTIQGNYFKSDTEALAAFDRALELQPDFAEAHSNRGIALNRQRRSDEALAAFDIALRLRPDFPETHYDRGNVLDELGRNDEALAAYDRALALRPDYPAAHLRRGNILDKLGRSDEALAAFDVALRLRPDLAEAYFNRGNVLYRKGMWEEALAAYDRALALRPDYPMAHFGRGVVLAGQGKWLEALADYDASLALRSDDPTFHLNRGVVLDELGRWEESLAAVDRALELRPDFAEAHCNRGIALDHLGRSDEALAAIDRALELRSDEPNFHFNRGMVLIALQRSDEALAAFHRALELRPDYADAYVGRGNALILQEKWVQALAAFDRALELRPDYPEAHFGRGKALFFQGKSSEALAAFVPALELRPNYAEAYFGRANALFFQDRFDEAFAAYDRALELRPDDPTYYYSFASCAVLVANWYGQFQPLNVAKLVTLRGDAHRRLVTALAIWTQRMQSNPPEYRSMVERELEQWQQDPALASVREAELLKKFSEEERRMWCNLWSEVAVVLEKARMG